MKNIKGERIGAAIIDSVILFVISLILTSISALLFSETIFDLTSGQTASFIMIDNGDSSVSPIYSTIVLIFYSFLLNFLMYTYIPYKMGGATLGKKLVKIKVIDFDDNEATFKQHLIRNQFNWQNYVSIIAIPLLYLSMTIFTVVTIIIGFISFIITFIIFIQILAANNGRGLHDMIANTIVVHIDYNPLERYKDVSTKLGDWADLDNEDEYSFNDDKHEDEWEL